MKYFAPTQISENMHLTPEGYLLCVGVSIGRIGEMVYGKGETPLDVGADGRVSIMRSEEDLFNPETLASFEGKPFTLKHPEEFLDPSNWQDLACGIIQNVRRGAGDQKDDVVADILVTAAAAIKQVQDGVREVSCGYEAEYIQTGEGKGKQINIIGNHLALVDQGRAGPSYAINDHNLIFNGKGPKQMKKKMIDSVKSLFGRAQDEAIKVIDESMPEEKKDDKKESKDEDVSVMDELKKMVADIAAKVDSMAPKKEEKKSADADADADPDKKDEPAKDAEGEAAPSSLEDRLAKLEAMVAKIMEAESAEAAEFGDEDKEKSEDDDEEEEVVMTGDTSDTAMRAEILAPGIEKTKDIKVKALKEAFGTKEGKKVILALNDGKAPTFDSAEKVNTLFIAASEVLKATRSTELSRAKLTRDSASDGEAKGFMTAEQMNAINAARYKSN